MTSTSSAGCRVTWENLGGLSGSEPGPQRAAALDTGGLCAVPRQADVLETGDFGGDKLSGLEFAGFSGQKTDFGAGWNSRLFGASGAGFSTEKERIWWLGHHI